MGNELNYCLNIDFLNLTKISLLLEIKKIKQRIKYSLGVGKYLTEQLIICLQAKPNRFVLYCISYLDIPEHTDPPNRRKSQCEK